MKKILAMTLSLTLVFGAVALPYSESGISLNNFISANAEVNGNYEYYTNENGVVISKYNGNEENVNIPEKIGNKNVVSVGESAFSGCTTIKSITIPDTVTSIMIEAFYGCSNLEQVKLSENLYLIDDGAFCNCPKLKTITIPESVEMIGRSLGFNYNELDEESKTEGFKINCYKGSAAYNYAVENDFDYKILNADGSDYAYEVNDENKTITITKYLGSDTEISIPDTLNQMKVTAIADNAFSNCEAITSVVIPDTVTSVGSNAFENTALLNNQNSNVKYADKWAVDFNCDAEKAVINAGTVGIADGAFRADTVYNEETNTSKNVSALKEVVIPDSVQYIGVFAFFSCENLKEVTIPKSVIEIGFNAFGYYNDFSAESESNPKYKDFKIKGYQSTAGNTYATENQITFELVSEQGHTHSYTSTITKQPTCTEKGKETFTCSCGDTYDEEIPATGHKFDEWEVITNATCTTDGEEQRKCSVCGEIEKRKVEAVGHSFDSWTVTKEATCTEDGEEHATCSACGETEKRVIAKKGHKFGNWTVTKKATCTANGEQQRKCSVCGEIEKQTIKATGHKYTTKVVKPTCTAKGYTLHTCSVCKKSYKDNYKNAVGHKYVKVKVVKPTLKSKGYTLYKCSACGATVKKNYVPALVSISKAKVTGIKNATCTGKQIKPKIKVVIGKTTLKNGRDYTVKYGTNKSAGKGTVTIIGKGKYTGKITKSFKILPAKTSAKVSSTKGKIKVTLKKAKGAKKYQIQYSVSKKFKGAKTITTSSTSKKLTAKSKKTYYVRVRSISGKYVSGWSAVKKIKVK